VEETKVRQIEYLIFWC